MMKAIGAPLAYGFLASAAPAQPEECLAASTDPEGRQRHVALSIDFASEARFDPAALPEGTVAVMCPRASIVPRPDDVRVLSEWRVPFGIADEGKRSLWISARAGRLQVTVDGGKLDRAERQALREWLDPANVRFVLDWIGAEAEK